MKATKSAPLLKSAPVHLWLIVSAAAFSGPDPRPSFHPPHHDVRARPSRLYEHPAPPTRGSGENDAPSHLPLSLLDPSLYAGRWIITSSNDLGQPGQQDVGFLGVEISSSGFHTFAIRDGFLSAKKISRHGSFKLLTPTRTRSQNEPRHPVLPSSGPIGAELLVDLEFRKEEDQLVSIVGIGLPELGPTRVQDLQGKRRRVRLHMEGRDQLVLHFLRSGEAQRVEKRDAANCTGD